MSRQNRVRKIINLDIKKEIISKRESRKSVGELSAEYVMTTLTISTMFWMVTLLEAVGLERITHKYIYFNVC
jgi:hypothetical protein